MRIVCDIDGVVVDPRKQVMGYLFNRSKWDWDEYFRHTLEMPPIPYMVDIVRRLIGDTDNEVIFLTGRPESNRELTVKQLDMYGLLGFSRLIMRPSGDRRSATEFKSGVCRLVLPNLMIEDDPETVARMTGEGLAVIQVHGYRIENHGVVDRTDHTPGVKYAQV